MALLDQGAGVVRRAAGQRPAGATDAGRNGGAGIERYRPPLRQLAWLVPPDPLKEAEQNGMLMTPAIRQQMHEMFREHIDKLGAMLGQGLRHWNLPHSESKAP